MARGWESKSVEAQQDEALARSSPENPRLTREEAARRREQDSLELSLRSVIQRLESSQDSRHRAMLEKARDELEQKIRQLRG
jgi:hypothetical protein